jgi:uncharacterized protein
MDQFKSIWPNWHEEKPYAALVVGILLISFLSLTANIFANLATWRSAGQSPQPPRTIQVTGEGKVVAVPDISTIDLGVTFTKATEVEAITEVTKKMNDILAKLRTAGIQDKDLNAQQYTVYPQYDYVDGRQNLSGYQATQQVEVKLNDPKMLSNVLKIAADNGANQISGLTKSIDDPENYRVEARAKAITNARTKAETLAKALGVRLGDVISFTESSNGEAPPYPMFTKDTMGMGGGAGVPAPDVPAGSQEVRSTVSVTFSLR